MLAEAVRRHMHLRIVYICQSMEGIDLPTEGFNLVISSLAFHFLSLYVLFSKIDYGLTPNGQLSFRSSTPSLQPEATNNGIAMGFYLMK